MDESLRSIVKEVLQSKPCKNAIKKTTIKALPKLYQGKLRKLLLDGDKDA